MSKRKGRASKLVRISEQAFDRGIKRKGCKRAGADEGGWSVSCPGVVYAQLHNGSAYHFYRQRLTKTELRQEQRLDRQYRAREGAHYQRAGYQRA